MEQVQSIRVPAQAVVWVEVRDEVEVEWADLLRQDWEATAFALIVVTKKHILSDNPAIIKYAQNVVRE